MLFKRAAEIELWSRTHSDLIRIHEGGEEMLLQLSLLFLVREVPRARQEIGDGFGLPLEIRISKLIGHVGEPGVCIRELINQFLVPDNRHRIAIKI